MQHTTNYNFSQYDATDRVTRSTFNSDNSKIDAALKSVSDAAQANASPWVKLVTLTTTEAQSSVSLDFSNIDLTPYAALKVYIRASCSGYYIQLNGVTDTRYNNSSGSGSTDRLVLSSGGNDEHNGELTLMLHGSGTKFFALLVSGSGTEHNASHGSGSCGSTLNSIDFKPSGGSFASGCSFTAYGVKR